MSSTHDLEGKPLWKLTDQQVLDAMRGRGNELETARTLASLCRIFAKAAETNPACAAGLNSAIGLTQVYGKGLAPGHEMHPFKDVDKNLDIASIMSPAFQPQIKRYIPPPVVKRTNPHDRFSVPGKAFDLDRHMEGVRQTTARPTSDIFIEGGSVTGRLPPALQNVPRPVEGLARAPRPRGPESKVGRMSGIILGLLAGKMAYATKALADHKPADLTYQDVQNALVKLRKQGKVVLNGSLWLLTDEAA